MRIDKFLVEMNLGSRSEMKSDIKKGLISVNGLIIKKSDLQIRPESDIITYQNREIKYEPFVYYMLNKPAGFVSATEDKNDRTVVELLSHEKRNDLFPVGRLDKDTEGLLILTNDGKFAHDLLSPRKHVPKTYIALLDLPITDDEIQAFKIGLNIGDEKNTLPADLVSTSDDRKSIMIKITEGRFHQIKRMFKVYGQTVLYLKRISMGNLLLDQKLQIGEYRKITIEELHKIRNRDTMSN